MELDVFHLFLWEPIAFEDTFFEINRVVLLMYFAALVTVGFFWLGTRKRELVPRGMQYAAETGYLFVRNNIAIDIMGPVGAKYAPFLTSLFFFIFFSNLLEILPFINFPVTSRMGIPAILALISWFVYVTVGLRHHGLSYVKDIAFPPGTPKLVYIILTPIELLSTFIIRPFTLAIRLLANMLAGHVLLTIFFLFTEELLLHGNLLQKPLGVVTFLVAVILVVFEFMVIAIQAYIFTTLTAFYIAEAVEGHGEEHAEETHAEPIRETELAPA
jgi:F-type H+-transporting ATPase subunit a